jgi:hypothetical protein
LSQITRGLGERQEKERDYTTYRIIGAIYTKPYTYQQLWRKTKIHRNTLKQRLDQLVNDNTIIKHHYTFPNSRGKYTGRDFYLLNWAKKQVKEKVSLIFHNLLTDSSVSIFNFYVSSSAYDINSIQNEGSKREYTLIRMADHVKELHLPSKYLYRYEFKEKLRELQRKESNIYNQIRSCLTKAESVKARDKLVEERNSILESIVLLCTRYCADNYLRIGSELSSFDMLVFFTTISLFSYWLPYVKIFEIMIRVGF